MNNKFIKPKACKYCKSEFIPRSSLNKYCSRKCKYKVDLEARSKKPKFKNCKLCSAQFQPYTSLDKFCSANCRISNQKSKRKLNWSEDQCKKILGINNPAYRNGFYVRGRKQKCSRQFIRNVKEIKQKMINLRGYIYCENCGSSNSLRFEAHHIVYRSEAPNHKNLHNKNNLLICCIKCHNWFHKKKDRRNDLVVKRQLYKLFPEFPYLESKSCPTMT